MTNPLNYYFTIYGEVYVGETYQQLKHPDYTILIQRSKIQEYNQLADDQKTIENISKYGYAIPNHVIAEKRIVTQEEFDSLQKGRHNDDWYEFDRSIMFIIGAGASTNCVYGKDAKKFQNSCAPPLGPHLFDSRFSAIYNKYPGVRQSLYRLQSEDGTDVEALFEEDWGDIYKFGNSQTICKHINIQYYLQELFQSSSVQTLQHFDTHNLYGALADKLVKSYYRDPKRKRKFAFVSFNQDNILERFLSRYSNLTYTSLQDYTRINDGVFSVFKPHGSWNWGWKFPDQEARSITIDQWLFQNQINLYKLYYEILGDYKTMVDWESYNVNLSIHDHSIGKYNANKSNLEVIYPGNQNMYFPALLLPYRDKDEFTMPSVHYWHLNQYLSYIETLVIIGWKGKEDAFNKLLYSRLSRLRKLIIVDPKPETVLSNLAHFRDKNVEIIKYQKGFEDFVINGVDKDLNFL